MPAASVVEPGRECSALPGSGQSTGSSTAAATGRPVRRTGYEHLLPMFAELAWLAPDHPRRRGLRAELIIGYLPVAQHIARKHASLGESPADLEQVAALGLVLAVDRFDPRCGVDFLAFAIPTIDGEVLRYHRDRSTIVRTPRPLHSLRRSVMRAVDELSQRLAHIPNTSEIAHELDLDPDVVADVLSAERAIRCASLDEPCHEDTSGGDGRLERSLGRVDPELSRVEDRLTLGPLVKALPERERRILQLRFVEELTQSEIGRRIGVSQMHVSRLIAATLAGLHRELASDPDVSGSAVSTSGAACASPARAGSSVPPEPRRRPARSRTTRRARDRPAAASPVVA